MRFHGTDAGREYVVECCLDQSLVHHLLEQDGQLLLVKEQRYVDVGKIAIMTAGQGKLHSGTFVSLDYFCNITEQYKAIIGLKSLSSEQIGGPMTMMLRPAQAIAGEYSDPASDPITYHAEEKIRTDTTLDQGQNTLSQTWPSKPLN